jgi:hypothetical protein
LDEITEQVALKFAKVKKIQDKFNKDFQSRNAHNEEMER